MFSVLSVGAVARSVWWVHAGRSESSRGLSVETQFHPCYTWQHPKIDVTGCGVVMSCRGVLWDRVTLYWTGSRYPGIQINRVQTSRT